jgi:hypothetical protein
MGHERDLAGAGELIAIEATESLLQDGDVPARIGAETVLRMKISLSIAGRFGVTVTAALAA